MGRFLGRQSAGESLTFGEVPLTPQVQAEQRKNIQVILQARGMNDEKSLEAFAKHQAKMEAWRPLFRQFIEQVLAAARQRPYPEASAFFEAFGQANVYQPEDFDSRQKIGVGERIAWVMFLYRETIATFKTVSELHKFLEIAAKPSGVKIGLKRVEALCRRIGLRFGAKRGRPRGSVKKQK